MNEDNEEAVGAGISRNNDFDRTGGADNAPF